MPISIAPLKRRLKSTWDVLHIAATGYAKDNATLMGAGVAFWAILSLSPMFVILLVVTSIAYDAETSRQFIVDWLTENLGGRAADWTINLLETSSAPGATTLPGIFSILLMVWSATRMFHALQLALNHIWNIRPKRRDGLGWLFLHLVRKRASTFLLLLTLALLLMLSLVMGTVMPVVARTLSSLPGWWYLSRIFEFLFSSVIICVGVGLVYMILPDARVPWRFVWRGALLTGALMIVGKLVLGWYLSRQSLGSYGAAGSVVALLLWIYFSVQVFFFGAELTQAYTRVAGWPREPEPHAERIERRSLNEVVDESD